MKLTNQFAPYLHNTASTDMGEISDDERIKCSFASTICTSRGAGSVYATFAYLLFEGEKGMKKSKEQVWRLTKRMTQGIKESKHYELICEPETTVVSFQLKANQERHHDIYNRINNSKEDNCFIGHSDSLRVKTVSEYVDCQKLSKIIQMEVPKYDSSGKKIDSAKKKENEKKYSGLYVHIMEHNTEEAIQKTLERLEEEAKKALKNK